MFDIQFSRYNPGLTHLDQCAMLLYVSKQIKKQEKE